jgi:hypothetical protein
MTNISCIIPNTENLKGFPLMSGARQAYPLLPLSIVTEFLSTAIEHDKELKGI